MFFSLVDVIIRLTIPSLRNPIDRSNNLLPQQSHELFFIIFALKLRRWRWHTILWLCPLSRSRIAEGHCRGTWHIIFQSHTQRRWISERGMRCSIFTRFYFFSRWFSLFCKLLFAVAAVDDARADVEQENSPLSNVEGLWLWIEVMIRTHPKRHVQLQLCGKRLRLTSNLSFDVVDVCERSISKTQKSLCLLSIRRFSQLLCVRKT